MPLGKKVSKKDKSHKEAKAQLKAGRPLKSFLGDNFLEPQYIEEVEERNINILPELGVISELGNNEKYNQTIQKCIQLIKKYPDFDFIYFWMGISYLGQSKYDQASSILIEGLSKSKSKAYLCCKLGEVEWKAGKAREALKWWCQSIHCHESNPHDLDNTPYLYLSAISGGFGLKKEYNAFTSRAFSIRDASLTHEAMTDIQNMFIEQKTHGMENVLKKMRKIYFKNY